MNSMNIKKMILAAIFTALTAIGAFIKIPLPMVPIVMQTFFVLLAGIIFIGVIGLLLDKIIGKFEKTVNKKWGKID